jgi:hypothetical protein
MAASTSVASSAGDSGWSSRFGSAWGRFTLRQLFLWTAFVAVACVALRNATPTWASSLLGAALVLLAASLLLAAFRDGHSRAFWIGFATVGWLYVTLLAYSTGIDTNNRPWNNPFRPDALITTQLSHSLYSWMCEKISPPPANPPGMMTGFGGMPAGMGMPMGSSMDSAGMGGTAAMYGGYDASGAGGGDSGYGTASGGMPGTGMMGPGGMGPLGPMTPTPFIPVQHDFTNVAHALWTIVLAACGGALASWLYTTRSKTSDAAEVAGSVQ